MYKLLIKIPIIIFIIFRLNILQAQSAEDTLKTADKSSDNFTLGGELRSRLRMYNGINFGDVAKTQNDYDTYIDIRGVLYADLQINKNLGVYGEIFTGHTFFKDDIGGMDKELLDISQLYLKADFNSIGLSLKLGRQSLHFGSGRILSASDNPNVPRTFETVRTTVSLKNATADFLIASPVEPDINVFNNRINSDNLIYGSYWVIDLKEEHTLDLYLFGNHLKDITIRDITATEYRYTAGTRLSRIQGNLNYNTELALQFGRHSDAKLSSYYLSSTAGYTWPEAGLKPSVGLSGTVYSGDRDTTDQKLAIFRPISSRSPINNAVPIGPANFVMLVPEGSLALTKNINFVLRYYTVWKYSIYDGLYSKNLTQPERPPDTLGNENGLFITHGFSSQLDLLLMNINLNISFRSCVFFAGEYIRNTGKGKTIMTNFLYVTYSF